MNGVLFRRSARSLWKTWVVFAAVLSLYVSMITAMFDPKLNATLDEIVTAMPQLMNMVGMQAGSSSLGGFLINYLYGFLLLLLPLVFSILAANRLVARWWRAPRRWCSLRAVRCLPPTVRRWPWAAPPRCFPASWMSPPISW